MLFGFLIFITFWNGSNLIGKFKKCQDAVFCPLFLRGRVDFEKKQWKINYFWLYADLVATF